MDKIRQALWISFAFILMAMLNGCDGCMGCKSDEEKAKEQQDAAMVQMMCMQPQMAQVCMACAANQDPHSCVIMWMAMHGGGAMYGAPAVLPATTTTGIPASYPAPVTSAYPVSTIPTGTNLPQVILPTSVKNQAALVQRKAAENQKQIAELDANSDRLEAASPASAKPASVTPASVDMEVNRVSQDSIPVPQRTPAAAEPLDNGVGHGPTGGAAQ